MHHDVFISFSSVNTDVAEKVCRALEESGEIKCWIAYRDIVPSANYAEQLVEAIESCKLVLLILSKDSNSSPQVSREIERAGSKGIPILPLRIEDVTLSKSMEYFISSHHWLDAFDSDIENYFPALRDAVSATILGKKTGSGYGNAPSATGKNGTEPTSGSRSKLLLGIALVLVLLVAAFLVMRPGPEPFVPAENGTHGSAVSVPAVHQSVPASPEAALIRELARRFRENKPAAKPETDSWTSGTLTIAFLDVSASGLGEAERDFVLGRVAEELSRTGRYDVVERQIIDKLLAELHLSSSALADPATALKLGRILSANLIVTGSLARRGEEWLAGLRFIETETTAIACSVSELIDQGGTQEVAAALSRAVDRKLRASFPLQARVVSVTDTAAVINIGRRVGVREGMVFDLLGSGDQAIGQATVISVDEQSSRVSAAGGGIETGMRLREQVRE